jgi:hypothetical protein
VSVTSVQVEGKPGTTVSLDTNYIRVREESGYLDYYYQIGSPYGLCTIDFSGSTVIPVATVSYTAGYATIPEDLKMAAVLIAENLYKETEGDDQLLSRITIGDYTEGYSTRTAPERARGQVGASDWITIKKILDKYKQRGQSAGFAGILG